MPDQPLDEVPPIYWLGVCRGSDAAVAWMQAPAENIDEIFQKFPILALPEFPAAMAAVAEHSGQSELTESYSKQAGTLQNLLARVQFDQPLFYSYLLQKCAAELFEDFRGIPRLNVLRAITLFVACRDFLDPMGSEFASALLNEGNARQKLAGLGVEPKLNLDLAIRLYSQARKGFDEGGLDFASTLMNEGNARTLLAQFRVEPRDNLDRAIILYHQARNGFRNDAPSLARALMNEGNARQTFAELGFEPQKNLDIAITLHSQARSGFKMDEPSFATALMNEGNARQRLALLGVEPRKNLELASILYHQATDGFKEQGPDLARVLANEGNARRALAELGVEPQNNLKLAITLFKQAADGFKSHGPDFANALMGEGNARQAFAELGVEPQQNLKLAIALHSQARSGFDEDDPSFATALMNEGNARQTLAQFRVDPQRNLELSTTMYSQARRVFADDGPSFARALMNEGTARSTLAELGVEPGNNLELAIALYNQATKMFEENSPDIARALMNEGNARRLLAERDVESRHNLQVAVDVRAKAGDHFLRLGHLRDALMAFSNQANAARGLAIVSRGAEQKSALKVCLDAWKRSITIAEDVCADIKGTVARRDWLSLQADIFSSSVEAALELGDFDQAMECAERGRGRTLIDLLNLRENRPNGIADETWNDYQKLLNFLESLDEKSTAYDKPNEAMARGHIAEATGAANRNELLALIANYEQTFIKSDPEYLAAASPPSAEAIRKIAGNLGRTVVVPWIGERRSFAFLIRPNEPKIRAVELPGVTTATVREWMFGPADDPELTGWIGTYDRYRSTGKIAARRDWFAAMTATLAELHEKIVRPIDAELGNDVRPTPIALLAGGLLGLLPFHAARPIGRDSSECWLDRVEILYGPSIAVLGRCEERTRPDWSPVLGVIDPSSNLHFSRWEGATLGQQVRMKGGKFASLFPNAKLGDVRKGLGNQGIVHFSCHGAWSPNDPLESGLNMADGRLTLRELLREKGCESARLVTLSACETGIGHDFSKRDDEYLGLPAGFLLGGAKAVVGSLWTVADPITALLMNEFYGHLFEGKGLAESLRQAQLTIRRMPKAEAIKRLREAGTDARRLENVERFLAEADDASTLEHPYYWAGFAAHGSGQPVI